MTQSNHPLPKQTTDAWLHLLIPITGSREPISVNRKWLVRYDFSERVIELSVPKEKFIPLMEYITWMDFSSRSTNRKRWRTQVRFVSQIVLGENIHLYFTPRCWVALEKFKDTGTNRWRPIPKTSHPSESENV